MKTAITRKVAALAFLRNMVVECVQLLVMDCVQLTVMGLEFRNSIFQFHVAVSPCLLFDVTNIPNYCRPCEHKPFARFMDNYSMAQQ